MLRWIYYNELDTHILDEDKLLDLMESLFQNCVNEEIGIVADYHTCELFPERWFDSILVLCAKTDVLFDRLTERGYSEKKRGLRIIIIHRNHDVVFYLLVCTVRR
jgi:adenylate kinase